MLNSLKSVKISVFSVAAEKVSSVEEKIENDIITHGLSNGSAPSEVQFAPHGDIKLTTQVGTLIFWEFLSRHLTRVFVQKV